VTGLRGFVGSHFEQYIADLNRKEIEVVPLAGTSGSTVDIRDGQRVADAIATLRPDVILHLAAIALPALAKTDQSMAWDVNVMGTLNVAQALRKLGSDARLIYVGSSESYGNSFLEGSEPLREHAALVPRSPYGATKASADLMIGQMALDGLNAVRFRPFNHTGARQSADYVVPAFARQVARIERGLQPPVVKVGNLEAQRDFLNVQDVVSAYALAALPETRIAPGTVMNLATGSPHRISDVLATLLRMAKLPISTEIDPSRLREADIAHASGCYQLARSTLGWEPTRSFEATISEVLEFWRSSSELGAET